MKKILFMTIFLFIVILFCAGLGVTNSNIFQVMIILKKILFKSFELTAMEKIILNLRLPRIILAVLVGIGLAGAGTIMQGITRNSLVSPFTIGISSSASFGASIAIVYGWSLFGTTQLGVVTNAFIFALLCTLLVFIISNKMQLSSQSLILSGIALNYFFQALSTSVQFLSDDVTLAKIVHWTFGSVNGASWKEVKVVALVILPCLLILYYYNRELSIISVNDDDVIVTMGIDVKKIRILVSICSSLITATIISFTGVIGFVGLVAPHIARLSVGNDYRYLLLASLLIGGLLVLISDTIGRIIFSPVILPVGIVISFLGVPIFLKQILSKKE
ncbi:iron ABC transporter permease [Fusobacterium sp.]|uniref:FecCD family ABC transporter permease n=1 Tax=Fusobacterium sp. TaxID=68766 RepID=UPI0025C20232|nr:iron ABC transporter permease [Fusobacterium sp.]